MDSLDSQMMPIMVKDRSERQINRLIQLSLLVPRSKDKKNHQRIFQRFINMNGVRHKKVEYSTLERQKEALERRDGAKFEKMDSAQQLLTRAIINKQSWDFLIERHNLGGAFLQSRDDWGLYEQWIIFVCSYGRADHQALYLSSIITKRSYESIKNQMKWIKTYYFRQKLTKWLSKDLGQLELIYYQLQRNLLMAIKQNKTFQQMVRELGLDEILRSPFSPLEYERNNWIVFLCFKLQKGKTMVRPIFDYMDPTIRWKEGRMNFKYRMEYMQKLEYMLKFDSFEQICTYEIQVCLLQDIKLKSSWHDAKKHIQEVHSRKFMPSRQMDNQAADRTCLTYSENNDTSRMSEANTEFTGEGDNCSKASMITNNCLGPNAPSLAGSRVNSNLVHNQVYSSCLNNNLQRNGGLFSQRLKNQQFQLRGLRRSPRIIASQQKGRDSYQSRNRPSIKVPNKQYLFSKIINNSVEKSNTQPNPANELLGTLARFKEANEQMEIADLKLSNEQRLILSLMQKLRQSLRQFEQSYFPNIPLEKIEAYYRVNRLMVEPMHRSMLGLYRGKDRSMANEIKNMHIKKLVQAILTFDDDTVSKDPSTSKMSEESQSSIAVNKETANSLVLKFDKIVADIEAKRLSNQPSKTQLPVSVSGLKWKKPVP